MNPIILRAESLSPVAYLPLSPSSTPHRRDGDRLLCPPELSEREPIRHLLIGSPTAVGLTIHRLHVLQYVDAGLWNPAIALSSDPLVLSLNPGEIMRMLVQSMRIAE